MIFMKLDTNNSFFWVLLDLTTAKRNSCLICFLCTKSHLLDLAKSEIKRLKIKANGKTKTDNKKLNQI